LRLRLRDKGKDRPAAFPKKPGPGEVLILQRAAQEPQAKAEQPAAKKLTVLTPEEAIKQRPKEKVTVQFKVAAVEAMPNPGSGFGGPVYYIFLKDGGRFTARLSRAADQIMRLGIEPVKHFSGRWSESPGESNLTLATHRL
jgi:hypothetical protein